MSSKINNIPIKNILLSGASGWFGKSFIYQGYQKYGKNFLEENYFSSSNGREIHIAGVPFAVKTIALKDCLYLEKIDYFVQSAFLTKDKLDEIGLAEYKKKNIEIINISQKIADSYHIKKHILISSGAAIHDNSPYGVLKRAEEKKMLKGSSDEKLIFRVYAASGLQLPNVGWSALSQFVKSGRVGSDISIKSEVPVWRSFVDFGDLCNLILTYLCDDKRRPPAIVDACNVHATILQIAQLIAQRTHVRVMTSPEYSEDLPPVSYCGSSDAFIAMCKEFNIRPADLEKQIETSLMSAEF